MEHSKTLRLVRRLGGCVAADLVVLLTAAFVHVPAVLVFFVVFTSILVAVVTISDYAVKDFELDEGEFERRLESMFHDSPEMLSSLNDPIAEPSPVSPGAEAVGSFLSKTDRRSHRRLTSSRSTDREVLRLCGSKSLWSLSLADIARIYGKTEEELVLFLMSRRPALLYRREYYRGLR